MASKPEKSMLPISLAAVALAALCWWFGSGLYPLWWLTWLAPLPVLWLAPRIGARWAALAAFTAYAIGGLNEWNYLHTNIGMPLPAIAWLIATPGVMLVVCVLLFRRLLLRGHLLAATLSVPTTWVALEYIYNLVSPHGTFGNIAYTQMDALAVIQIAAVTGLWGVGFIVLWLPTTAAVLATPRGAMRVRVSAAAMAASAIAAVLVYGIWRLQAPATTTMRIGLVCLDKPAHSSLTKTAGQSLEARYASAIERLAGEGAKIVVIPETTFITDTATVPAFAELATRHAMTIGAGLDFRGDPEARRNMLSVIQPGSISPATYSKRHLLVGFEDYKAGHDFTMLKDQPRIGLAICKDMDFHDTGLGYAAQRAQLLLVPASDFTVDGRLHSRMAVMRGVENGFAIARAAHAGRLTLSDDRGRVMAEASSENGDAELVGDLSLRETRTLYSSWGDWFAWLDLIALLAWLLLAWWPARDTAKASSPAARA